MIIPHIHYISMCGLIVERMQSLITISPIDTSNHWLFRAISQHLPCNVTSSCTPAHHYTTFHITYIYICEESRFRRSRSSPLCIHYARRNIPPHPLITFHSLMKGTHQNAINNTQQTNEPTNQPTSRQTLAFS